MGYGESTVCWACPQAAALDPVMQAQSTVTLDTLNARSEAEVPAPAAG